ncbi:hypothetical protein VNO77_39347 [Canavalia gladiata]|uniref:Uncharacterized protein n=1 Tax=Canavalia gladiata TaxID=3824 RepID=A0AAN9PVQ6_CANGL
MMLANKGIRYIKELDMANARASFAPFILSLAPVRSAFGASDLLLSLRNVLSYWLIGCCNGDPLKFLNGDEQAKTEALATQEEGTHLLLGLLKKTKLALARYHLVRIPYAQIHSLAAGSMFKIAAIHLDERKLFLLHWEFSHSCYTSRGLELQEATQRRGIKKLNQELSLVVIALPTTTISVFESRSWVFILNPLTYYLMGQQWAISLNWPKPRF